jgi:hypothetical protein
MDAVIYDALIVGVFSFFFFVYPKHVRQCK